MRKCDVLIVGAGASGLMAALAASESGRSVIIVEKMNKIGKKLLATGNGKCNYTNTSFPQNCYRGRHPEFAWSVLERFDDRDTVGFFRSIGIFPKEKNGYLYPMSEQASSVVSAFETELFHRNAEIRTEEKVLQIQAVPGGFRTASDKETYESAAVILAAGGKASPKLGSDGSGYALAESFGHHIIPLTPALTGLKCAEKKFFGKTAGVRVQSRITIEGQKECYQETGELQLTSYGISGIPVFQLSRYAGRLLRKQQKLNCIIDFLPSLSEEELTEWFYESRQQNSYKSPAQLCNGLLNSKLAAGILASRGLLLQEKTKPEQIGEMVQAIKGYPLTITGINSFEEAQVTAGGVSTAEIHESTMESRLQPGLYLTGELLDIDGACGGYNLQWAWSTGFLAGKSCGREEQK